MVKKYNMFHLLRAGSLLILTLWNARAAGMDIYVSPSGNDSSPCTKDLPCKTLNKAFLLVSGHDSIRIMLAKGNYTMKKSHHFSRMATFGLFGNGSVRNDVTITCDANASLSFTRSENISFKRVRLLKCGGWLESSYGWKNYPDLRRGVKFVTALDFRYCRNLAISDVEISSSPGLGANLNDVGGFVSFRDSVFADNKAASNYSSQIELELLPRYVNSGGGVFVILNKYGDNTVIVTPIEHDSYQHNNHYSFTNCQFLRNEARWSNASENEDLNTPERPFSSGGGLAMFFKGNASGCNVAISACKFINNSASWGGGLQVVMEDKTQNNSFIMQGTTFLRNNADLSAGGARMGNIPFKHAQLSLNRFNISNCSFVQNKALWGGGASIFGGTIPSTKPAITQFYFTQSNWRHNKANVGAALGLYLYNYNEYHIGPQIPYRVCFDNDTVFEFNHVDFQHGDLKIGQGTLYSMEVPLIFKSTTKFWNNSKSALVLDGSTLKVHGQLEFINNTGLRGGAIAMYGRSRIIFHENANSTFEANSCEDKGGAMYIEAPGPPLVSFNATGTNIYTCFFAYSKSSVHYDEWNTTVIFKDNRAPRNASGNSVYVTTLKSCWQVGENRTNNSVLKWKFVKFDNLPENFTNFSGEVATDPVEIEYVKTDWNVAPGQIFNATVKLHDEVKNLVPGIVDIVIINSSSVNLNTPSALFLTTGRIINISLCGMERSKFSVQLNCKGSQFLTTVIGDLELKSCYAGFRFSNGTSTCKCMDPVKDEQARGVSHCADGKNLYVKQGYWAGQVQGNFSTYVCPDGYCKSCDSSTYDYLYREDEVCKKGRNQSSILCGQCDADYTVTVGSEKCTKKCTNLYLLLLIPYAVGLLLIVMGIMLIDLDVFTGYLNAWVYSYQVMRYLAPDGFTFNSFSKFVIALTNCQIKVGSKSFCLVKGLDDADKLMVMYLIPVYVLVVVVLLARIVSAFPNWCFSRRVRAPFRGICSILVLCYTDITYISLKILRPARVGSKIVLYVNGEIDYFSGKHLYYGIVACLFVVLVLLFPLFLLFRPLLTRGLRPILNLNRWNPFFDALQSCFKDRYRWCAAFYFICRLGLLVFYEFIPAGLVKRLLLEVACILILLTFAILRPYKEARDVEEDEESYDWMNKSDVALLTTLSFIAVASSPYENSLAITSAEKRGLEIFLNVLSCVPIAVLMAVLAFRFGRRYLPAFREPPEDDLPIMSETSASSRGHSPFPTVSETTDTSATRHSSKGSRSLTDRSQASKFFNDGIENSNN